MGVKPSIQQIGQYQVLEILGQGGMGVVYRVLDATIGKTLAIKMLKSSYAEDPDLLERFYREAKTTANLQHRNIVGVYSLGHHNGKPYIVMEYLEGTSLSDIIASRREVPLGDKLDLVIQVCEGLQYAHDRHLIHRDIKPANIIVLQDGTAKIVDFGIARVPGGQSLTQTGQLVGSPWYMSPEQINAVPLDSRTDVFSTGVTLYELLTYTLPFKGDDATSTFMKILRDEPAPLSQFLQNYPPELDDVLKRVLAKKVDERYQTAEELGFDLMHVQKGLRQEMAVGLIERAEAAIQRGDLERAKLDLQEVLKFDRQDNRANALLTQVRQRIQQQQRNAQVVQMRSQAQVAFAGEQYEEALASADQAVRLNPDDPESIQLRDQIQQKFACYKAISESLRKAESSLLAGDFDDAKAEIQQALQLDQTNAEGHALLRVVEKELAERSRRIAVQSFVDSARQQISERKFEFAIDALRQAEQLDPADSNVRELLDWAVRGHEQEKRRNDIEELTSKIDGALRCEDFVSACTLCEIGLGRFPEDPTLLKLREIAERQRDISRRRSFVKEQSIAVRKLMDRNDPEAAMQLLEEALRTYPNEPNFEKLRAYVLTKVDQLNEECNELARLEREKRTEAEAYEKLRQSILECAATLRRMLDANEAIDKLVQQSQSLKDMLPAVGADDHVLAVCSPLLHEAQSRLEARNQALEELGQFRRVAEQSLNPVLRTQVGERALAIQAGYVNEPEIQSIYAEIVQNLQRWSKRRESAVRKLVGISKSIVQSSLQEIQSLRARAQELAQGFELDAEVPALLHQIEHDATQREQKHGDVLYGLHLLQHEIDQRHSATELLQVLQQARSLSASFSTESDVADAILSLHEAVDLRREILGDQLKQLLVLDEAIRHAASVVDAENALKRARELVSQFAGNSDVQEILIRLEAQVQGRRIEHDLVVEELKTIGSGIDVIQSLTELGAIEQKALQSQREHTYDSEIPSLCSQILSDVRARRKILHLQATVLVDSGAAPKVAKAKWVASPEPKHERRRLSPFKILIVSGFVIALTAGTFVAKRWWDHRSPPAPRWFVVKIESDPPHARIHIKGLSLDCETPCNNLKLAPGSYEIEAVLESYTPSTQSVEIRDQAAGVYFKLLPLIPPGSTVKPAPPVSLLIQTDPGATVSVDDKPCKTKKDGTARADVSSDSTHIIRVQKDGYKTREQAVYVGAENAQVSLPLEKDLASISITKAPPGARVLADGKYLATVATDGTAKFQIGSGMHTFALSTANGTGSAVVRSLKGGDKSVFTLPAPPATKLTTTPPVAPTTTPPADNTEADWNQVKDSDNPDVLQSFVDRHPSSLRADAARSMIDELDGRRALTDPSRSKLQAYLDKHPNGQFAHECRDKLEAWAKSVEPSKPTPTPPGTDNDSELIRKVIHTYAGAMQEMNLARIRRVRPGLTDKEFAQIKEAFDKAESIQWALTPTQAPTVDDNGASAHVTCDELITVKAQGSPHLIKDIAMFTLRKDKDTGWYIEKVTTKKK